MTATMQNAMTAAGTVIDDFLPQMIDVGGKRVRPIKHDNLGGLSRSRHIVVVRINYDRLAGRVRAPEPSLQIAAGPVATVMFDYRNEDEGVRIDLSLTGYDIMVTPGFYNGDRFDPAMHSDEPEELMGIARRVISEAEKGTTNPTRVRKGDVSLSFFLPHSRDVVITDTHRLLSLSPNAYADLASRLES